MSVEAREHRCTVDKFHRAAETGTLSPAAVSSGTVSPAAFPEAAVPVDEILG